MYLIVNYYQLNYEKYVNFIYSLQMVETYLEIGRQIELAVGCRAKYGKEL